MKFCYCNPIIIFGKRVCATAKEEVKRSLGINKEGGEGTYLGLPECFSGSKRKLLNFLQEKTPRASQRLLCLSFISGR